jgi:hypothetical protein
MAYSISSRTQHRRCSNFLPTASATSSGILSALLILTFASAEPTFAAPSINPGDWEYTMKMKIEGLGIPLPQIPVTFTGCITQSNPTVETPEMKKAGCKIMNQKISGNNVTYTGRCASGDSVTDTNFKMNFQGNSMTGTFDQVSKFRGKVQSTSTGTISSKRLGPCTKKDK